PAALDKFETARRVHWAGLGRAVADPSRCTIETLREAITAVITEPRYHQRAQALHTESTRLGGAQRLAHLLEQLAIHPKL
ncbi:MAG: glycosyl transferase, partial [Chloroflexi bacterium]|nr:glycosyl transferase [Chloroflexota bacterium]